MRRGKELKVELSNSSDARGEVSEMHQALGSLFTSSAVRVQAENSNPSQCDLTTQKLGEMELQTDELQAVLELRGSYFLKGTMAEANSLLVSIVPVQHKLCRINILPSDSALFRSALVPVKRADPSIISQNRKSQICNPFRIILKANVQDKIT